MGETQLFLNEIDVEIIGWMARGLDNGGVSAKVGKSLRSVSLRINNLMQVFGATTREHLVAIAIASSVVHVPDLYDDDLASHLWIRNERGATYHLHSMRVDVAMTAAGMV